MEPLKQHQNSHTGEYTAEQKQILATFREFANAKGCSQTEFDDGCLLRFLRSKNFQLEQAQDKLMGSLEWRTKNDVENIMSFMYSELDQVREHYQHGYHQTDKSGRPIYIERIGLLKLQQLFQVTTEDRLLRYYTQSYEILQKRILPACSEAAGRPVEEIVVIFDLKGFTMKLVPKNVLNFIEIAAKIAQQNYPERLGKMFIVNAPMQFQSVWSVIKPWIDEKTRNKITLIGSGYIDLLQDIIDISNIPDFLGGKSLAPLHANIGPWNPTGTTPLFPCEQSEKQPAQGSDEGDNDNDDDEDDDDKDAMDFAALRSALSGNISGPFNKAPVNQNKYELTTQGAQFRVSETPLNTQADEDY